MGGAWQDPISHIVYGDGNPWYSPTYAYDGDPDTRAGTILWLYDRSERIEFAFDPIYADRIGFHFAWTKPSLMIWGEYIVEVKIDDVWTAEWPRQILDEGAQVLYFTAGGGFSDVPQTPAYAGWLTAFRIRAQIYPSHVLLKVYYLKNVQAYYSINFSADPLFCFKPLTVAFTDLTTWSPLTGWDWDFGDGTPHSDEQSPVHIYEEAGLYSVTLTVTGGGDGSHSLTRTDYVLVHGDPVVAGFSVSRLPERLKVQFTDESTGPVEHWAWSFGDSGSSSLQSPTHEYGAAGRYTVSLTVYGPDDCVQDIETKEITVPVYASTVRFFLA